MIDEWRARLPDLIHDLSARWQVVSIGDRPADYYHYVAYVELVGGVEAVLKICAPQGDADCEYEAIHAFQGSGFVRLLAHDDAHQAFLMERIRPGTTLAEVANDDRAAEIAAEAFRRIRRAPEGHFPNVERWCAALFQIEDPIPRDHLERARALWRELSASSAEPVLCHGDLHQYNILDGGDQGWVVIDPKGVFAEPAFETGAFLRNLTDRGTAERRIAIFAERLGLDRERIWDWAYAQAVLSACWSVEDGDEWDIGIAELFRRA